MKGNGIRSIGRLKMRTWHQSNSWTETAHAGSSYHLGDEKLQQRRRAFQKLIVWIRDFIYLRTTSLKKGMMLVYTCSSPLEICYQDGAEISKAQWGAGS